MPVPFESPALLFVCLGNICRSPMAEGAFRARLAAAGMRAHLDSAGTGGWHVGAPPDHRACAVAARHGVDISSLRARQVDQPDFDRFTHIFALDSDNLRTLARMSPARARAELRLLMDLVPGREGQAVADPYYGTSADFERSWAEVDAAAEAFVQRLSALR
jgi:protein-tyrosine phosphatase